MDMDPFKGAYRAFLFASFSAIGAIFGIGVAIGYALAVRFMH